MKGLFSELTHFSYLKTEKMLKRSVRRKEQGPSASTAARREKGYEQWESFPKRGERKKNHGTVAIKAARRSGKGKTRGEGGLDLGKNHSAFARAVGKNSTTGRGKEKAISNKKRGKDI